MRWDELEAERCSVARALSVIGDRWTLLVLRDCFLGVRRFDDFQGRLGVTRHILADRLRKLVEAGVLDRVAYSERPARHEYRLTDKGRDLYPVLLTLIAWGDKHMSCEGGPPMRLYHQPDRHPVRPQVVCATCGEPITARDVVAERAPALGKTAS